MNFNRLVGAAVLRLEAVPLEDAAPGGRQVGAAIVVTALARPGVRPLPFARTVQLRQHIGARPGAVMVLQDRVAGVGVGRGMMPARVVVR